MNHRVTAWYSPSVMPGLPVTAEEKEQPGQGHDFNQCITLSTPYACSWRRWEQAFEAYDSGDEVETFQAVDVRLRECLVSFIGETMSAEMMPEGQEPPTQADFKG